MKSYVPEHLYQCVRNLFEQILVQQANRLAGMETVTREDLTKLLCEDVEAARNAAGK